MVEQRATFYQGGDQSPGIGESHPLNERLWIMLTALGGVSRPAWPWSNYEG
jgi:hypothetical protein